MLLSMTSTATDTTAPATSPVPELKAAGVNSMLKVLRDSITPAELLALQRVLPPPSVSLITRPRLAQEWVPLEHVAPIYETSLRVTFKGDAQKLYELGRQQLRNDMSGIYRVFMRVASPWYVADKTASIYAVYARHCGTLELVRRGERQLEFLLAKRPYPSHAFFESLRGSVAGALELTGVKDVVVSTIGEPSADSRLFRASWK
ncbi:MAG TPA: hypothetical protein VGF99_02910 [Myxococcota bacterium]